MQAFDLKNQSRKGWHGGMGLWCQCWGCRNGQLGPWASEVSQPNLLGELPIIWETPSQKHKADMPEEWRMRLTFLSLHTGLHMCTRTHTKEEEERRRRKRRRKENRKGSAIPSPSTSNTGCLKASRNIWNKNDLKCRNFVSIQNVQ